MVVNSCASPALDEAHILHDDAHELRAAAGVLIRRMPNRFWARKVSRFLVKLASGLDGAAERLYGA